MPAETDATGQAGARERAGEHLHHAVALCGEPDNLDPGQNIVPGERRLEAIVEHGESSQPEREGTDSEACPDGAAENEASDEADEENAIQRIFHGGKTGKLRRGCTRQCS
jgi:hypothetical protein